jgi:hypothetical protein
VKNVVSGKKEKNMRKLIYKLYNENMISEEVVHILLDKLEE